MKSCTSAGSRSVSWVGERKEMELIQSSQSFGNSSLSQGTMLDWDYWTNWWRTKIEEDHSLPVLGSSNLIPFFGALPVA